MALSGQLSDLSLAELIEFFCNQRKTGRLKVAYERAPGYFYFDRGDLVDAKLGSLSGVEAIYYALTLANASFKFSAAFEAPRRTIHQPWTQVTLEGLRRLDEGIKPKEPFAEEGALLASDEEPSEEEAPEKASDESHDSSPLPLSFTVDNAERPQGRAKFFFIGAAVLALVAVIGVPAGWYAKGKAAPEAVESAQPEPQASNAPEAAQPEQAAAPEEQQAASSEGAAPADGAPAEDPVAAARRAREARERARLAAAARQPGAAAGQTGLQPADGAAARKPDAPKAAPKMISVQVTYDEAGRVTQTSGGDSTAQRIARQKRFPTGKAGTTTITIPIN